MAREVDIRSRTIQDVINEIHMKFVSPLFGEPDIPSANIKMTWINVVILDSKLIEELNEIFDGGMKDVRIIPGGLYDYIEFDMTYRKEKLSEIMDRLFNILVAPRILMYSIDAETTKSYARSNMLLEVKTSPCMLTSDYIPY